MRISDVHLLSDGNDLVVRVKRRDEWHELIRTHGPLRDVSISYIASEAEYTAPLIYSEQTRAKLTYRVEAAFRPEDAAKLHPGQPLDVTPMP